MKPFRRLLVLAAALSLFAIPAGAASADDVVAQARRYIGKDRDIDAVRTLHYRGRIEISGANKETGTFEMLLEKPNQQKTVQVIGDRRTTVGLDDTVAWNRVESVSKPALSRTGIMDIPQMRLMRASSIENLCFFRGTAKEGIRVEHRGETASDGRATVRLAFVHPDGIVFVRTFESATGRLLHTEGPGGGLIREEGEQTVAGLRFPQRLVSTSKADDGSESTVTIFFDEIKVNETFPADTFSVPLPGVKR